MGSLQLIELKIKTVLEELEWIMSQTFQENFSISNIQAAIARVCGILYEITDRAEHE